MAIFARGTLALLHNRPRTVTEYKYRGRAQQREESGMSNMTNETNPACQAPQQEAQPAACYVVNPEKNETIQVDGPATAASASRPM